MQSTERVRGDAAPAGAEFASITDLIARHARERPTATAIVFAGQSLDYASLDAQIDRVAASLQRDGVRPGDVVTVCAGNSVEYLVTFFGGLRAGCAVALVPLLVSAESVAAMVGDAAPKALFLDAAAARILDSVGSRGSARRISIDGSDAGDSLEEWLAPPGTRATPVAIRPEGPSNIIYSSGTTGTPKGIVQPHVMRWVHVQRSMAFGFGTDSVDLVSTPLHSNTTLVSVFPALGLGGVLVLMAKFDAAGYLALAQRHRATHTMLVPVQYQRLLAHPEFDRHDLASFRAKFCTSSHFPADLKAEVLRRWPGALIEYYGMSEGGGTMVLRADEHPGKLHTVGKPGPGTDVRLIDDEGREVGPGEVGEVVGHSAAMMTGYHNRPDKTAEAEWFDATGKRFIRTGDVGRFDEDGFLVLLDRKKDMIISGGFNIYPSDLEDVMRRNDAVLDVAVVGLPSARWGETPVAFVVARPGTPLDTQGLLAWSNERLGKVQRIAAVVPVETLPRSPIGKVLKRELREAYKAKLAL